MQVIIPLNYLSFTIYAVLKNGAYIVQIFKIIFIFHKKMASFGMPFLFYTLSVKAYLYFCFPPNSIYHVR
jgi:hypothetical protein